MCQLCFQVDNYRKTAFKYFLIVLVYFLCVFHLPACRHQFRFSSSGVFWVIITKRKCILRSIFKTLNFKIFEYSISCLFPILNKADYLIVEGRLNLASSPLLELLIITQRSTNQRSADIQVFTCLLNVHELKSIISECVGIFLTTLNM